MDLSMSLNCSTLLFQINMDFIDEQRNADLMDAMADIAYEQRQALMEEFNQPPDQPNELTQSTTQ